MPKENEFRCSACEKQFNAAFLLLQHFAFHASNTKQIPDLYPISLFNKKVQKQESDLESDSGVEDVIPIKFCLVTMPEDKVKIKKYECQYCSRKFGWPTDLKRHLLIHTGEKPFGCDFCDLAFTRNFLLKKHQRKCHNVTNEAKVTVNDTIKSRKQDKCRIRKRVELSS